MRRFIWSRAKWQVDNGIAVLTVTVALKIVKNRGKTRRHQSLRQVSADCHWRRKEKEGGRRDVWTKERSIGREIWREKRLHELRRKGV